MVKVLYIKHKVIKYCYCINGYYFIIIWIIIKEIWIITLLITIPYLHNYYISHNEWLVEDEIHCM